MHTEQDTSHRVNLPGTPAGVTIINTYEPSGVRAHTNATLALADVTISAQSDIHWTTGIDTAPLEASVGGTIALLQGVNIDRPPLKFDVKADTGTVATDSPDGRGFKITGPSVVPLADLPMGAILAGDEPALNSIRTVRPRPRHCCDHRERAG